MRVFLERDQSPALLRRLAEVRAAAGPGGRANTRALGDLRRIVVEDNRNMMLRGVDRYGQPRAPLAPSTLARRDGDGPSLIPRGMGSRFITTFRAEWRPGPDGSNVLVAGWEGFVGARGFPIPLAHITGASRGNWTLPRRDVGGTTPAGWAAIRARMARFARDVLKGQ